MADLDTIPTLAEVAAEWDETGRARCDSLTLAQALDAAVGAAAAARNPVEVAVAA